MDDSPILTRLDNGARVVSQTLPGREGVAVGLWLLGGSRWEPANHPGVAHLWEHVFLENNPPGCNDRLDVLTETHGLGLDAHTTRELTAFTTLVSREAATAVIERLVRQLSSGTPDPALVNRERATVTTELATGGFSDPAEESVAALAWPHHPMGRRIGGRSGALAELGTAEVARYQAGLATGGRVVLAVAGDLAHEPIAAAAKALAHLPAGDAPDGMPPVFTPGAYATPESGVARLVWAAPAPAGGDGNHAAAQLANHILAGGLSSRLFRSLREDRRLVYDVRSRLVSYSDCALWLIETVCDPARLAHVETTLANDLAELRKTGPDAGELEQARRHLSAALRLSLDDARSTMERIAQEVMYRGRASSTKAITARLGRITPTLLKTLYAEAWERPIKLRWGPSGTT